jgi:P-type Cu+ transporter
MEPVSEFREFEGLGAQGTVAGKTVAIGSRLFMEDREMALPPRLKEEGARMERSGKTVAFFGWEKRVRGFAVLGDRLKPGSRKLIQDLNAGGRETWLLSGDSRETTRAVARELGIANYKGQASPAEKAALLRKIREKGRPAGMVGDGINDAAALAAADVGISLGSAENLAREAADLTLLTPDPGRILEARDLSVFTAKIIRQNLFFAFAYNVLAIPLAISGYLNPLIAVSAMFLSSLTVTGNALRIGRAGKNL